MSNPTFLYNGIKAIINPSDYVSIQWGYLGYLQQS